jgi:hypothetical protein
MRWRCILVLAVLAQVLCAGDSSVFLPGWLKLGGEIRGRGEGYSSQNDVPGNDDVYYLQRLRFNMTIEARPWLRFFGETQDARPVGYTAKTVTSSVKDTLDWRQGYVEIGADKEGGWVLRVGRQDLTFGDQRLVGAGDWGNVGRVFDAVKVSHQSHGARFDLFASSVVANTLGETDKSHRNVKLYGLYTAFSQWLPNAVVEPYVLWKSNSLVRDEAGLIGDQDLITLGVRAAGQLTSRTEYKWETAFQTGTLAHDSVRAWAGAWSVLHAPWQNERAPRLGVGYNYASGDSGLKDGRHGGFDELYSANYPKNGAVDRFCWQNIHQLTGIFDWKIRKPFTLRIEGHDFWLASIADALYTSSGGTGTVWMFNPNATSRHLGEEIDFRGVYKINRQLTLQFGLAHLFRGDYMTQCGKTGGVTTPYLMWKYKF